MAPNDAAGSPPRADLVDAAGWMLLGAAVLTGSITMDRLADQDVPPFAAPGLLPGLLGVLLLVLGGVLLVRSLRRVTSTVPHEAPSDASPAQPSRGLLVVGLCVLFGTVLVGHGLPFWAAAASFVAVAIPLLRQGPGGTRRPADVRGVLTAIAIGLAAGLGITLVFQELFLVRLP